MSPWRDIGIPPAGSNGLAWVGGVHSESSARCLLQGGLRSGERGLTSRAPGEPCADAAPGVAGASARGVVGGVWESGRSALQELKRSWHPIAVEVNPQRASKDVETARSSRISRSSSHEVEPSAIACCAWAGEAGAAEAKATASSTRAESNCGKNLSSIGLSSHSNGESWRSARS